MNIRKIITGFVMLPLVLINTGCNHGRDYIAEVENISLSEGSWHELKSVSITARSERRGFRVDPLVIELGDGTSFIKLMDTTIREINGLYRLYLKVNNNPIEDAGEGVFCFVSAPIGDAETKEFCSVAEYHLSANSFVN